MNKKHIFYSGFVCIAFAFFIMWISYYLKNTYLPDWTDAPLTVTWVLGMILFILIGIGLIMFGAGDDEDDKK